MRAGAILLLSLAACEVLAPLGPAPEAESEGAGRAGAAGTSDTAPSAGHASTSTGGQSAGAPSLIASSAGVSSGGRSGEVAEGGRDGTAGNGVVMSLAGAPQRRPSGEGGESGNAGAEDGGAAERGGAANGGSAGTEASAGSPNGGFGGVAGSASGGLDGGGSGGAPAAGSGNAGGGGVRPSCHDQALLCGTSNEDCCASELLPGDTFLFERHTSPQATIATVDSFYLDTYEVTVGRFKAFLAHYDAWRAAGNPVAGANALPKVADSGWQAEWNAVLPADAATFRAEMSQCPNVPTIEFGDALPANCVWWEEAFAFCLWDDARLPTSIEWEYAAAGGNLALPSPWGTAAISHDRAVYECLGDGLADCALSDILPVGSKPLGRSRWGQDDLFGSMAEFVFDYAGPYPPACDNCALATGTYRTFRGGNWRDSPPYIDISRIDYNVAFEPVDVIGFRCARPFD